MDDGTTDREDSSTPGDDGTGTGTPVDVSDGCGNTPAASTAGTSNEAAEGSIADRIPNQDSPTATAVTTAHAARYPIDRLIATSLQ